MERLRGIKALPVLIVFSPGHAKRLPLDARQSRDFRRDTDGELSMDDGALAADAASCVAPLPRIPRGPIGDRPEPRDRGVVRCARAD